MAIDLPELTPEIASELCNGQVAEKWQLRRYEHWTLYLYGKSQQHLGRAYAWLSKRHVDFHPLSDLTVEEWTELTQLIRSYEQALALAWKRPELINCEWLGNLYASHRGHGHMHLIPRYGEIPYFLGRPYPDLNFGKRSDYGKCYVHQCKLVQIRDALRAHLPSD